VAKAGPMGVEKVWLMASSRQQEGEMIMDMAGATAE
jgi:hypothetical protein